MRTDHVGVETRAGFWRALQGFVVHMMEPETLRVPVAPLVVVEERPREIASDVCSGLDCGVDSAEVIPVVGDAERVLDEVALGLRWVVEGRAVLRVEERDPAIGRVTSTTTPFTRLVPNVE